MLPLVIGPEEKEAIRKAREFAENPANRIVIDDVLSGKQKAAGDSDPRYALQIPMGFKVVYSIDKAPDGRLVRHMSVSTSTAAQGRMPHPLAMTMICREFGYVEAQTDFVPQGLVVHALAPWEDA